MSPERLDSTKRAGHDAMMPRLITPFPHFIAKRFLATATLCLLVGGCAGPTAEHGGDPEEKRVFSVALHNLTERYIEPIDAGQTMTRGLAQLAVIDDRLAILERNGVITITYEGNTIAEYQAPAKDDIGDWASLSAAIIRDARSASDSVVAHSQDSIYRSVFAGLIKNLDRYSRYLPPDDARRSRATRDGYGGIGITISVRDGEFIIHRVLTDRPADAAGLKTNDQITQIDGQPVKGLPLREVLKLLRGDIGDSVRITVRRADAPAQLHHEVIRDHIVPQSVTTRQNRSILEIKLTIFNQGTVGAVRKAVVDAVRKMGSGLTGIVLDLRSNPGGLLDQAIAVADLFMGHGRIVSTKGRHPDSNQIFDATPGEVLNGMPMAVLINGRSASAAEIVGVALRDTGRAAIVGSTSYGKGSVQTIIRLPNRGEMNITWARIMAPTGLTLASQGIVPAICTNLSPEKLQTLKERLADQRKTSGITVMPGFAPQANLSHFSVSRRTACPSSNAIPVHDLEIARLVLANRDVYAMAIANPAANIAER
jgi:carboxyl-terminal processing protease